VLQFSSGGGEKSEMKRKEQRQLEKGRAPLYQERNRGGVEAKTVAVADPRRKGKRVTASRAASCSPAETKKR